ncbi:MAG: alpha/beta fold hydrolase [Gemmatimonas sp.]|nr:alpha/beta fold hydrolase [Gemmatimonas sp.]
MKSPRTLLLIALLLILVGGILAWRTQTAGGRVSVRDLRWVAPSGQRMSGLLYVPNGVTAENPAPGIAAIHGYINSRETQSGFAIEFARRGFVVLAADQTGHGYSDPPAFSAGFGGPAALAYLRSLDFVDTLNIGLEGHSMGGWAAGMAASALPDGYRSIALVGSSTGTLGVPDGTPEWPRNLAVIFSVWDEFSQTMWGTPIARDVAMAPKLQAAFGIEEEIQPGRIYGSIPNGTARVLYQPRTNHPGDHLSTEAIGNAVEWFQMTLDGGSDLAPTNQIWYWKEVGTLLSAIGMVLLLFPVALMLLRTDYFADLASKPAPSIPTRRPGWWANVVIAALLGPLTLFTFKGLPERLGWQPSALFPQSITNGVIAWTTTVGLLTLVLLLLWHFVFNRKAGATSDQYGLTWSGTFVWRRFARSILFALLLVGAGYGTLLLTAFLFQTDYRFWVFAVKPLSPLQLRTAIIYFVPFAFFFLVLDIVAYAQLRRSDWSMRRTLIVTTAVLAGGYLLLYLAQYVPMALNGTMAIADEPLWTIISYQFLPIMTIVGLLFGFLNRESGTVYPGAFAAAMLVSWIVVASQATHVPL